MKPSFRWSLNERQARRRTLGYLFERLLNSRVRGRKGEGEKIGRMENSENTLPYELIVEFYPPFRREDKGSTFMSVLPLLSDVFFFATSDARTELPRDKGKTSLYHRVLPRNRVRVNRNSGERRILNVN